jgi:exodeoxyribonuclease VII small subunit
MPTKKRDPEPPSFEQLLKRLEEIVNRLEQGDVPLEDSLKLYEEGLALSKTCGERLAQAELTLKRLSKNAKGAFEELDEEEEE